MSIENKSVLDAFSYEDHPENVPINTFHGWVLYDDEGHWTPIQQGEKQ